MTVAVVVATGRLEEGSGVMPGLPRRLLDQLASLNVPDSCVITRPRRAPALRKGLWAEVIESEDLAGDLRAIARLARTGAGPLLILPGHTVASGELLDRLVGVRPDLATAVTAPLATQAPDARPDDARPDDEPPGDERVVVRIRGGRVASAGSGFHRVTDPNGVFCGPLRVCATRRRTLARVSQKLAGLVETPGALPEISADASALLLVGLVREGVAVTPLSAPPLICVQARTTGQAVATRAAAEAVDEDRVRLDAAVKSDDGFFTTYAVSTYSRFIARWAARRGLTPDLVTSISMGVAVLAALWFAAGTRTGMVVGAVLFYFAFVFDCVDGQLARYTRRFSTFGAWLDATFDRAKEYVVYAGLAIGSTVAPAGSPVHGGDVWGLAVAALVLQTCRHMVDFSYGAANRGRAPEVLPVLPLTMPGDVPGDMPGDDDVTGAGARSGPAGPARAEGLAARLSSRTQHGALRWAKKIIVLPIGERFALISITAALGNARVTFIALLAWGSLAAAYTLTGRALRSLSR